MGALTESEIFDCLASNFKLAAEHAADLGKLPKKGPTYIKFRAELKLLEGACRQAAYWRQDARWLRLGLYMEETHKRAGDWLRGYKLPSGVRVTHREGTLHPLFMKLAENLRAAARKSEDFRDRATGRMGMILPKMADGPHRDTRPVPVTLPDGFQKRSSGLIVPAAA